MGAASCFHSYYDSLTLGKEILVVDPGYDKVDLDYWSERGNHLYAKS